MRTKFVSAALLSAGGLALLAPLCAAQLPSDQPPRDEIIFAPLVESDELVRLPNAGSLKTLPPSRDAQPPNRLIPGGGLLLSFDSDQNGQISPLELEEGIQAAYAHADKNKDGRITPLEQIRWAEQLPNYDSSLTNPVRFDPNLDRRVSASEFTKVIMQLAERNTDAETGYIFVDTLSLEPKDEDVTKREGAAPPRAHGGTRRTPAAASRP